MTWGVTTSKPGKQQVKTVAGQLPDDGNAVIIRQKLFASKKAYICAGMMLVCGLLTIIGGICQDFAIYRLWGKFYGWSIWTGVLFTITGTCAVLACNKQSKPRLVSATVFSILTVITALVVIIFFGFCVAKGVKMHHRRMEMEEGHHGLENVGEHSDEFGRLRESGEYGRRHHRKPHHGGRPHHEHHHHRHAWPRPTGHPWPRPSGRPRPTGHPWPRPTGHPRPRPTGHPWPRPTGHPWPRPTGHPWPRPTGHPWPRPTGHPWPRPTHHWPRPTGHPWPRPTGHPWPRPTGHPWPRPTSHHWPRPTGHPWPRPTGHPWPAPTRQPMLSKCKFTHGWPAMMLFVASLIVITLVSIELVISVILSIIGVRSLKAAKYVYVPSKDYKILG